MANDKDFIVKNTVEVGGSLKTTVGTITANDIDLSTGNYFIDTLTGDTTYTFSNPGAVQSFQLEVTGVVVPGASLATAVYDAKTFSVLAQDTSPDGLFFKADGTAMYVLGDTNSTVFQYTLSTAWDVSTASYASKSFVYSAQTTQGSGMAFKPDGTKMYIVRNGASDFIYQYTLSTAWDVSTASYDSKSLDVAAQDSAPQGVAFKTDGTKMYLLGNTGNDVTEYDLSTAWDISTASFLQVGSVGSLSTTPMDFAFSSDGTVLFVADGSNDGIHSFTLSTAWDVSTLTEGDSFSTFVALNNAVMGFAIGNDSKFYHVSRVEDTVYQYSFNTPARITWPASVEWAAGTAAPDVGVGETDLLSFVTSDSGASYLGFLVQDNLS